MPLRLAANLSWLFCEAGDGLGARRRAAAAAGFGAVEGGDVYAYGDLESLRAEHRAAGLQHVLINSHPGNREGDHGLAAVPGRERDFRDSLDLSIKYAQALDCPRIHVKSGKTPSHWQDAAMQEVLLDNLCYAADRLSVEGMTGVLEPINAVTIPHYYLNTPDKVLECILKVNHPNMKMLLDLFHLQMTSGNLTANIVKYLPYTDHVQAAQAPLRTELDAAGEVNYAYVLDQLNQAGYSGWLGLEYKPSTGDTIQSLKWRKDWGI